MVYFYLVRKHLYKICIRNTNALTVNDVYKIVNKHNHNVITPRGSHLELFILSMLPQ